MSKEKIAKALRVITAPPVLISVTLLLFWCLDLDVFASGAELLTGIILLGLLPALAYPLQKEIPSFKEKGRDGQRKLAFPLSIVGYALGFAAGLAGLATRRMMLVYAAYLISVLLLTFVNKCLHEKASGHACSATASLCFAMLYIGGAAIIPCFAVYAAMAWSSVALGRHSARNIVAGTVTFIASLAIALLVVGLP